MRLTHLRFANLNSLVGEWSIDFTHPDYLGNGIFAITGPTGSGKTTLLDAICLALFGRTPRLAKISRSANEIMARQTGQCFAEATFETGSGSYRAHWSQHRARRKPDGELQTQKHELSDANTGKILESSLRGVAEQIEHLIGMDFERFTRSVLLAQGSFAAFLQASADERSPILEQITGTELYSQISIRVHELRAEQRTLLESLQTELETLQILEPDALAQLEQQKQLLWHQHQQLSADLRALDQAQQWLERIARLEKDQHDHLHTQHALEHERRDFEPQRQRLQRAQKALELSAHHAGLLAAREQLQQSTHNLAQTQHEREALVAQVQQAQKDHEKGIEQLQGARQRLQNRLPLLRQVSELDRTLNSLNAPIEQAKRALTEHATRLAQLSNTAQSAQTDLITTQRLHDELHNWLQEHVRDQELISNLEALKERWANVQLLRQQAQQLQNQAQQAKQEWHSATKQQEIVGVRFAELSARNSELQSRQQTKEQERLAILGGQPAGVLQQREAELSARLAVLRQVEPLLALVQAKQATCQVSQNSIENAHTELTRLEAALELALHRLRSCEREVELLEKQHVLEQRIVSLEQLRTQLRDGEPCPLCGSDEHPFSSHQPALAGDTQGQLNQARNTLLDSQKATEQLRLRQASTLRDLQHARDQHASAADEAATLQQQIHQLLPELESIDDATGRTAYLTQHVQLTLSALTSMRGTLHQLQAVDTELERCRQQQTTLAEALEQARSQERDAREHVALCKQLAERSQQTCLQAEQLANNATNDLLARLHAYQDQPGQTPDPERLLVQLTERATAWAEKNQQWQELARRLPQLQASLQHTNEQLEHTRQAHDAGKNYVSDLQEQQRKHQAQRTTLYEAHQPEDEERELHAAIEHLQASHQQQATALASITARQASLIEQEKRLHTILQQQQRHLTDTGAQFQKALSDHGFADEPHYLQACMVNEERQALMARAKHLDERNALLQTRLRDTQEALQAERARQLWSAPPEKLLIDKQDTQEQSQRTQQQLGAINEQLRIHAAQSALQQEKAVAIQAQQEICRHWDNLHELIGSADGKKYRNFAQGLTFDVMISHANRQLASMSDRYLLVRDSAQPLDLNVIDNHQGGEVRSTRNLSGGESFLVSLALALGLSAMSSRNVRVDSLFLDEGFGTLDEDALDTALETLSGLHQDGKLIGVISHIPALKERIGVQIQVTPVNGGRSRLSGPGCLGPQ